MSSQPDFKIDPNRDATDSIRGYVYQAYQSVLAWMELKENEILVLEGAEDFDIHNDYSVTTTQVKDVSGNLTLRTQGVVDSLNNFWDCCEKNPEHVIALRFLSTAEAGQEQGSPFGSGQKGLEYWKRAESDQFDTSLLRAFLLQLKLNPSLAAFTQEASDDKLREKLIRRIKWDLSNSPREALQYIIEDKLKIHGLKLGINSYYSCQALPHLLKKVADLLSTKGMKELRLSDFISSFDDATTVAIPRSEIDAMSGGSNLHQLAARFDLAELARLTTGAPIIGRPMPIVDGGIPRTAIVSTLAKLLRDQHVIFLFGSSGLGKTNLASLLTNNVGGNWGWAGFRSMQPGQIKDILTRAAFEMNLARLPPFLVLDDVDLSQVALFEREFISLVFSIINANGLVIVTGPMRPPLQLLPKIWKSESCEVSVSYFDEIEVEEMVRGHGLSDGKHLSAWARTIWFTTSGHPQLVHARVRTLSAKGWPSIELSDLTKPEDVERVRSEARDRLVKEFPSENTRLLAYRLSLTNGAFSRETALAVAETPPPTKLPGESFDALVGPWVEREGENRYRVSPLLTGAANNVLSGTEIKIVHGAIARSILSRNSINQFELSTAFFHAFMAKDTTVLTKLAYTIITTEIKASYQLHDVMSWFALVGLKNGQMIFPENPSVDFFLRMAQYKLICCAHDSNKAIDVIERIEESLRKINSPEQKEISEAMAYGMILNTIDVQIPSSIVVRILSRMIDVCEANVNLKEISDSFNDKFAELPLLGEAKPAQLLFSYQGARLSGLDDLLELITTLDALPSNKRDHLLAICIFDMDFANLLISRAWWKEVKDRKLDVNKALPIFNFTAMKSREWKAPELTKACLVAISLIYDEYDHSSDRALEVLDAADKDFPNEARLLNQRAKVLFHANRDKEAIAIANKALELPNMSDVEFVFCCRDTGIASAKYGDWAEAERLFRLGAEKANNSSFQKAMSAGLMADAALALWKQMKYESSLSLYMDTLDLLAAIPLSEDIRIRHLHATVRHSIAWIHFEALGQHPTDFMDPLPGMCSNQEPHEGIKDYRVIDISASWEILAITERILGLEIGVKDRVQAATSGIAPLFIEGYGRVIAFRSIFKNMDFDSLIPKMISMFKVMYHHKNLEKNGEDGWSIGIIPELPDGYWKTFENRANACQYVLKASVILASNNQANHFPIKRWRSDFADASVLTGDIDQFLNVLNGAHPDESLYQQSAAIIYKMSIGYLSPLELWKGSFRLLNALGIEGLGEEAALENLLLPRWIFAIKNQRFAFAMPTVACSEIEKCCEDLSHSGFAKIAIILDIAIPYLNVHLSADAKQMLERIIEGKTISSSGSEQVN